MKFASVGALMICTVLSVAGPAAAQSSASTSGVKGALKGANVKTFEADKTLVPDEAAEGKTSADQSKVGEDATDVSDGDMISTAKAPKQFEFSIGPAGIVGPLYPGAKKYTQAVAPMLIFNRMFGVDLLGDPQNGFFYFPDAVIDGPRIPTDAAYLKGTKAVGLTLELGAGVGYHYGYWNFMGSVRQGIGGQSGQVAEFGIDRLWIPNKRLFVTFGPRLQLASRQYMQAYFGVSQEEAAASDGFLREHDAKAGVRSVGLKATATYELPHNLQLHVIGDYQRYVGAAASSPLAEYGSKNSFFALAGLTYKFSFNAY